MNGKINVRGMFSYKTYLTLIYSRFQKQKMNKRTHTKSAQYRRKNFVQIEMHDTFHDPFKTQIKEKKLR